MKIGMLISGLFILMGILLLVIKDFYSKKNRCKVIQVVDNRTRKYAILIPARDESKVIEGLLESIVEQTRKIDMDDVYIIVEGMVDKTVEIAKRYHANVVLRRDLKKRRKGYALDDAFHFIKEQGKKYDAYFIFDADNVLSPTFVEKMDGVYQKGYDIGIGYRNTKNGNQNLIAASSSLTFSMINALSNKKKCKRNGNCTISGTGFYIKGTILEELGGYPFHTLTEDYELTLFSILKGYTSFYEEEAVFFDEQPLTMKQSIVQRTRWIKGFLTARRKYIGKIRLLSRRNDQNYGSKMEERIGILPYGMLVIGALLYIFLNFLRFLISADNNFLFIMIIAILAIYIVLVFVTVWILNSEKEKLDLDEKSKVGTIFFYPIFLSSYIWCFIKAVFCRNLGWGKIEHQECKAGGCKKKDAA